MAKNSDSINVNPRVIEWARETYGYSIAQASKELGISEDTLIKWENKENSLSIGTIKKLSRLYKRSFEVFLLPAPPNERPDPKYRLSEDQSVEDTRVTKLIIREAKWLQDAAAELDKKVENRKELSLNKYTTEASAEKMAGKERGEFGVNIGTQIGWFNEYSALKEWVRALEAKGLLIFQISMPSGVRGFSIPDEKPPVIAINTTDTPKSRIFTLFHEYAHILLGESGVCDSSNPHILKSIDNRNSETWCNQFAAAFLMPEENVRELASKLGTNQNSIAGMVGKLKVSSEALLIRLYRLGIMQSAYYKQEIDITHARNLLLQKQKKEKFEILKEKLKRENKTLKIDVVGKIRREKGTNFIRLVLYNKNKGFITTKDAMDYLSSGADNLDKLQSGA